MLVEIKLEDNEHFPVEKALHSVSSDKSLVWGLLDCHRKEKIDNSSEECKEEELTDNKGPVILTFAAPLGQQKPQLHSPFSFRIGQYLTKFLFDGQGCFDLENCLRDIPRQVALTEYSNMSEQPITIFGRIPQPSWDGSFDEKNKPCGEGQIWL